jgi:2-polyprenyl-3-methyl-5-hydroxy-6-metoxy-1,4-benzoquinol methylase
MDYKKINYKFWQKSYYAPNVESYIFRFYGYYLKKKKINRILDFGCGQGAATNFFNQKKIETLGVDISKVDINKAKKKYKKYKNNFIHVDSIEDLSRKIDKKFDVIIAGQSLYYLNNNDLKRVLNILYNSLKKNGVIFASMISSKSTLFKNSRKISNQVGNGIREVKADNKRKYQKHFINFTKGYSDLLKKFKIFKKLYVGYYSICFDKNNDLNHHYTFIGCKK